MITRFFEPPRQDFPTLHSHSFLIVIYSPIQRILGEGQKGLISLLQSVDYPDVYAAGDSMFVENGGFIPMSAIIARSSGIRAIQIVS